MSVPAGAVEGGEVCPYCLLERCECGEPDWKREYIVVGARGYPAPHAPWPQTPESVERFQRARGGEIQTRLVTEWRTIGDRGRWALAVLAGKKGGEDA